MVEELAAYWVGSLLADEILFDGRGRKWMQRKAFSGARVIMTRFFTGLRSLDYTVPILITNGIWQ